MKFYAFCAQILITYHRLFPIYLLNEIPIFVFLVISLDKQNVLYWDFDDAMSGEKIIPI
jgi:hypothetical protein